MYKKIVGFLIGVVLIFIITYNYFLLNIEFKKILILKTLFENGNYIKNENIKLSENLFINLKDTLYLFENNLSKVKVVDLKNVKIGKSFIAKFEENSSGIIFYDKKSFNQYDFKSKEKILIDKNSDTIIELARSLMELSIYKYNRFSFSLDFISNYNFTSIITSINFNDYIVALSLLNGKNIYIDILNKKIFEFDEKGISIVNNISIFGNYASFLNVIIDDDNIINIYDIEKNVKYFKMIKSNEKTFKIFNVYDDYLLYSDGNEIRIYQIQNDDINEVKKIKNKILIIDAKWKENYIFGIGVDKNNYYLIIYMKNEDEFYNIKMDDKLVDIDFIENDKYLLLVGENKLWVFLINY